MFLKNGGHPANNLRGLSLSECRNDLERWHITQDTLLTSEWGTPNQVENGVIPEELLQGRYGHQGHVWDLR